MNSSIRSLGKTLGFQPGDHLILFGEYFPRGYVHGLVQQAQSHGVHVIYSTVGRRSESGELRSLSSDELAALPKPLINVPLEAGFDLEENAQGEKPVDLLSDLKLSNWEQASFSESDWSLAQKKGRERFTANVKLWVQELEKILVPGKNVHFAHLMAGGVLRAKILLPLMNRVLKGSGDRFLSSQKLWDSPIGKMASQNFFEVTAESFHILIQETKDLCTRLEKQGTRVAYSAYGYHGTEILIGQDYIWQTYTPYIQGWAKLRLEEYARKYQEKGLRSVVYNCPEILTNSSAIFSGVEVSLYPLVGALQREVPESSKARALLERCQDLLRPGVELKDVMNITNEYFAKRVIRDHCDFQLWPQHNSKEQLETMLDTSKRLVDLHKDQKSNITEVLSELVVEKCGQVMFHDILHPASAVSWINHDVIARLCTP